ncbi:MAG: YDG domain-containing protein [Isosphaeraceae bacterium]
MDIAGSELDESGILAGDSVVYSPPLPEVVATFADKNVGNGKAVTVTGLHLSGADAGNYAATATATADITRATLAVSGVNADKVYDGTTNATLNTAGRPSSSWPRAMSWPRLHVRRGRLVRFEERRQRPGRRLYRAGPRRHGRGTTTR